MTFTKKKLKFMNLLNDFDFNDFRKIYIKIIPIFLTKIIMLS